MPNKRTVDPTGEQASIRIIGLRVTEKQLFQISELCKTKNIKRSRLFRDLLQNEWEQLSNGDQ
jgi:predicted component of type VI protein secretion system